MESVDRQISYWRSQVRRQFLAKLRAPSKKPERAGLLFLASRTIRCAVTRMDPRLNSPSSLQSISVIRERIRERRPETRKRYSVFCTYFRRRDFFLGLSRQQKFSLLRQILDIIHPRTKQNGGGANEARIRPTVRPTSVTRSVAKNNETSREIAAVAETIGERHNAKTVFSD